MKKAPHTRRKPVVEEIEPRILYSADLSPGLLAAAPLSLDAEHRMLGAGGEFAAQGSQQQSAPVTQDQQATRHEVVFVDTATPDYQKLVDDIKAQSGADRQFDVVLLDPNADGIKQISATLSGMKDVSAVHLIGHGADGEIELGGATLDFDSLVKNAAQIKSWGQALTVDADLLIYGCDVAENADGQALVDALARLTGADVAASENLTGAADKGGDWILEYRTGGIATPLAISTAQQLSYSGTLATFDVTSAADSGAGSLRAAITSANATGGADIINFNIAGGGVHTITLASALPSITDQVTIDGTTQPGFAGTPLVELNGAAAGGSSSGLSLTGAGSSGSTIKGLAINGFSRFAISIVSVSNNNVVSGNYLGIDASGTVAKGNLVGIWVATDGNTIGGLTTADRNVISGNTVDGIQMVGATHTVVEGNYIGLNAAGTAALANTNQGVAIFGNSSNNTIGGAAAGAGNVIAGNTGSGLRIDDAGETGNAILRNAIYGNTNLGIDLNKDGVTANDVGDGDTGGNNLQNYPVLTSAITTGAQITINGSLNSTAGSTFRIEFFASVTADPSGHGEAERYLGFVNVTTPGSGNIPINATLLSTVVAVGEAITATATDLTTNDTSEFSLNVLASNTAPVLDASKTPVLNPINEDAGAPSGAMGTLISSLVDFAIPAGQVDNVTDVNAGAQLGVAVTAANTASGNWFYSINGGTTWNALGAVVNNSARLLAADANTRICFQPNPDFNGTLVTAITFRAWDQTSGSNGALADTTSNGGSAAFSSATDTAALTVNPVNDAPVNTVPAAQSTNEDTALVFSSGNSNQISIADVDAGAGSMQVTLTGTNGAITLAGVAGLSFTTGDGTADVTMTFTGTTAAINTALNGMTFAPAANFGGGAALQIVTNDQGNMGAGGAQSDSDTVAITVIPVNDVPAGADKTVTTLEDTAYTFAATDFGFSDFSDSPANVLNAVKISTIPGAGTLLLSGAAVTAGQTVSAANIAAGNLKFTPAANTNGAGYASFTFQVQDDGGTANGGVDLDQTPNTMTVNVTAVNDAPAGTNNSVTMVEDTAYTFAAVDFGFTDAADSPANALMAVKISTIPVAGTLALSGVTVSTGQTVLVTDITAGSMKFTPGANANGAGYASFTFQVQDDGGTANGGVDLDPSARTMTIDVTAVNDAPQGTSNTVTTLEDNPYTFAAVDFGFGDAFDSPADSLLAVKIATMPGAGTLSDNGVAVTAGQFIALADITSGKLIYTPGANASGAGYASFTFQVQDDGGTTNGGVDLDPTARTMSVNVTAVNDAPAGADNTVTTVEDVSYTFLTTDFGFTDSTDTPANALASVRIGTLPGAGTLTDNGVVVTAGQFVTVADISGGKLVFTPVANANGAGYASFTFQVQDSGGTANGGVDVDPIARTMTIDVNAVDTPPVLGNNTLTIAQGGSLILSSANLSAADIDTPTANLTFTVSNVTQGYFELVTTPGVPVFSFTQGAVGGGQVRFVQNGSAVAPTYDVAVSDGTTVLPSSPMMLGGFVRTPVAAPALALLIAPAAPVPIPVATQPPQPDAPVPVSAEPPPAPTLDNAVPILSGGRVVAPEPVGTEAPAVAHSVNTFMRVEAKLPRASLNPAPSIQAAELSLLIQGSEPSSMEFGPSTLPSWSAHSAFPDEGHGAERDQIAVIMESVEMGGLALSVGVVWWASRVGGLLGSLLASMPAWRHLDPLPIVGRDEDEEEQWAEPEDADADADADELAVDMVLGGAQPQHAGV